MAKLVDASDFDSDDESHGGSSPSSVAISRVYFHTSGKKEGKAEY